MARKYLVTEIQVWDTGAVQNPTYAYDDENKAVAKYHNILAAAAVSTLPVHSALMFTDEGQPLRFESFTHEATTEDTNS